MNCPYPEVEGWRSAASEGEVLSLCRQGRSPDGTIVTLYLISNVFLLSEKSLAWKL
jgi:hypothetical protein